MPYYIPTKTIFLAISTMYTFDLDPKLTNYVVDILGWIIKEHNLYIHDLV